MARVMSPSGTLAVGFSDADNLKKTGFDQHNFLLYTPEQVQEALRMNGFTFIKVSSSFDERLFCILAKRAEWELE